VTAAAAKLDLTPPEVRVLGCLLEKQRTTPDAYPLSLNALRLACNQSTNRDPVVDYDEVVIRDALERLQRRGLARFASGAGSRAAKFRHLLADRLPMDGAEQAILCVLMLRGPQTPGELKQRGERMHAFTDLGEVAQTLQRLGERELVARLERRPGQKEERYAHLLGERSDDVGEAVGGAADGGGGDVLPAPPIAPPGLGEPVRGAALADGVSDAQLLARVERLEREVAELRAALGEPLPEGR
jgi:uncharacterized protein YceH (UPF0502 family)